MFNVLDKLLETTVEPQAPEESFEYDMFAESTAVIDMTDLNAMIMHEASVGKVVGDIVEWIRKIFKKLIQAMYSMEASVRNMYIVHKKAFEAAMKKNPLKEDLGERDIKVKSSADTLKAIETGLNFNEVETAVDKSLKTWDYNDGNKLKANTDDVIKQFIKDKFNVMIIDFTGTQTIGFQERDKKVVVSYSDAKRIVEVGKKALTELKGMGAAKRAAEKAYNNKEREAKGLTDSSDEIKKIRRAALLYTSALPGIVNVYKNTAIRVIKDATKVLNQYTPNGSEIPVVD